MPEAVTTMLPAALRAAAAGAAPGLQNQQPIQAMGYPPIPGAPPTKTVGA
jgi:hypothetical protein